MIGDTFFYSKSTWEIIGEEIPSDDRWAKSYTFLHDKCNSAYDNIIVIRGDNGGMFAQRYDIDGNAFWTPIRSITE